MLFLFLFNSDKDSLSALTGCSYGMCRLIGDEVPDLKPFIPTAVLDNCDLTRLLCVAFIVLFCLFIYFIMVILI